MTRRTIALLLLLGLGPGCERLRSADDRLADTVGRTRAEIERASPQKSSERGLVRVEALPFLGDRPGAGGAGEPLPIHLERPDAVTLVTARSLAPPEMAQELEAVLAVPVRLGQIGEGAKAAGAMRFSGRASDLLDMASSSMRIAWRYRNGVVTLFGVETRTYTVLALAVGGAVETGVSAQVAGASSSSSSSSGSSNGGQGSNLSSQQVTNKASLTLWPEIDAAVKAMLPREARYASSPTSGTITVTASPAVHAEVARYVESMNRRLGRQIALDVKVVTVQLRDTDQYMFDLAAILNDAGGARLSLLGPRFQPLSQDAGSVSLGVINPPPGRGDSKFDGSRLAIQALSQIGQVATRSSTTLYTVNGKPVPYQVMTATSYLKSVSSSAIANAGNQVSLEPGTVTTGYNLVLVPRIVPGGGVLLQFALGLSELKALRTVTSGGSSGASIQVPEVDSQTLLNEIGMASGSTLVLSFFERDRTALDRSGLFNPDFFALGGGRSAQSERTIQLVMVTPEVQSSPLRPRPGGDGRSRAGYPAEPLAAVDVPRPAVAAP